MNNIEIPSFKTLYIEMFFNDVKLASGSGFLIARNKETRCVFITNKHNVTGRNPDTNKHISSTLAEPNFIEIHFHKPNFVNEWVMVRLPLYRDDGSPYWYEHPSLPSNTDVVALNLNWGNDVACYPYYLEEGQMDRESIDLRPSETVSVIGFPFGLSSFDRFPIWSTGFLAQDMERVNKDNPVFLIDCRARQGQSGSAVIVYRIGEFRTLNKSTGEVKHHIAPNRKVWDFLGVYSGRVNTESDLGRVWHISILFELYDLAVSDYEIRKNSKRRLG